MARTIKPTFKQWVPGGGRKVSGDPTQGKTRVAGRISVTSYVKGGETLTPADLGLTTIDAIQLRVREQLAGPSDEVVREVAYSASAQQFYLFNRDHDGDSAERAGADTEEVEFVAEGDTALDPELL